MIYETKVWDAYGNLKKIISCAELHQRHWDNYKILEENSNSFVKSSQKRKLRNDSEKAKSNLDNLGDETH